MFDSSSGWGIDNGPVSKLYIYDKTKKSKYGMGTGIIVEYDRDWVTKPMKPEHTKIYQAIMAELLKLSAKMAKED